MRLPVSGRGSGRKVKNSNNSIPSQTFRKSYECQYCTFTSFYRSNYNRHLNTSCQQNNSSTTRPKKANSANGLAVIKTRHSTRQGKRNRLKIDVNVNNKNYKIDNKSRGYLQSEPEVPLKSRVQRERTRSSVSTATDFKAKSAKRTTKRDQQNRMSKKVFKCCHDQCDFKSSNSIYHVLVHEATHKGQRPFKCKKCNFSATQLGNLKTHQRKHTGEKPYACKLCNYRATQSSHLRRHEITHTGENPFKCNECPFQAREKIHLKIHKMTHTGEKPFECRYCDFASIQAATVRKHETIHTGKRSFSCEFCPYSTKKWMQLKRHVMSKHKINQAKLVSEIVFQSKEEEQNDEAVTPTMGNYNEFVNPDVLHHDNVKVQAEVTSISDSLTQITPKFKLCSSNIQRKHREPGNSVVVLNTDQIVFACEWCTFESTDNEQCYIHAKTHFNQ